MSSTQFYLTLPSNSKTTNTAACFETSLPQQINLEGNWECALCDFIYPNTWFNVLPDQATFQFFDLDNNTRHKIKIVPSRYETVQDLVKAINEAISFASKGQGFDKYIQLTYNELWKFVKLTVDQKHIKSLKFSEHVTYMLGFTHEQLTGSKDAEMLKEVALHPPDMHGGMHYLYLYCDVLQPQIVGNTLAPLLQVVNVEGRYMDIVNRTYISPHYVPVLKKCFSSIEINIKNDQNQLVTFAFGKCIVKLHFRKVQTNYFL
jgi:hypothetical protein